MSITITKKPRAKRAAYVAYGEDTIESAYAKAKALGRVVLVPAANELFVDIDNESSLSMFMENISRLRVDSYVVRPSPSREQNRLHITVTLTHEISALERIALQAMLGSDPVREMLSWKRLQRGVSDPTLFFEVLPFKASTPP